MNFKVGDKVKFLSEKGGGVVTAIVSPTMVKVSIEDGFEIPTLVSNLIKVDEREPSSRLFRDTVKSETAISIEDNLPEYTEDRVTDLINHAGKKPTPYGVYLAFIPHNQQWLITGLLDIYLVNHTSYTVMYNYFLKEEDGSYTGMDMDMIPPESKIYLQSIERDEIEGWSTGILQVMFHSEGPGKVLLPSSTSFDIRNNRFIKEDNYKETSFLQGKALTVSLVELAKQGSITGKTEEVKSGTHEPLILGAEQYREPAIIDTHRIGPGEAEVDLHIEELVENVKSLEPDRILKIQMDYFYKCLDSAIASNYHRVFFIHGVGNGTLKSEIRLALDRYEGIEYTQASMLKYGVGAIDVKILHN